MIELRGGVPDETAQALRDLHQQCGLLGINFLVVGAAARDLVLVHGFGAKIQRATEDVDFAVHVSGWEQFRRLKTSLADLGYEPDPKMAQRLRSKVSGKEIDLVPFGGVASEGGSISWPPEEDFEMVVLGFQEALDSAFQVKLSRNSELVIPVASPEGVALLKLIAWVDRDTDQKREKDALDLGFLIESYSENPLVFDSLYDDGFMEELEFDQEKASAMKLGRELAALALEETRDFIESRLFREPSMVAKLVRQMSSSGRIASAEANEWIEILSHEFSLQTGVS